MVLSFLESSIVLKCKVLELLKGGIVWQGEKRNM